MYTQSRWGEANDRACTHIHDHLGGGVLLGGDLSGVAGAAVSVKITRAAGRKAMQKRRRVRAKLKRKRSLAAIKGHRTRAWKQLNGHAW